MTSPPPNPYRRGLPTARALKVPADLPARFAATGLRLRGERVEPRCEVPGLLVLVRSGIAESSANGLHAGSHDDDT
jgi:hypothetical protein